MRALKLARSLDDGTTRIEALVSIAPHLLEPVQTQVRREWLSDVTDLGEQAGRTAVLEASIEQFTRQTGNAELPTGTDYEFWSDTLRLLGSSARKDVLKNLPRLLPLTVRLGGEVALAEAVQAIAEVGTWFP
jgi:hypothetical protein